MLTSLKFQKKMLSINVTRLMAVVTYAAGERAALSLLRAHIMFCVSFLALELSYVYIHSDYISYYQRQSI